MCVKAAGSSREQPEANLHHVNGRGVDGAVAGAPVPISCWLHCILRVFSRVDLV